MDEPIGWSKFTLRGNVVTYLMYPPVWIDENFATAKADMGDQAKRSEVVITEILANKIKITVARDGLLRFDFGDATYGNVLIDSAKDRPAEAYTNERVRLINAFLACLHTAVLDTSQHLLPKTVVTGADLVSHQMYRDRVVARSTTGPMTALYHDQMRKRGSDPVMFEDRLGAWITSEAVRSAIRMLDDLLRRSDDDRAVTYADLLLRGCGAAEAYDFTLALNLSWVVIESLLGEMWRSFVRDNTKRTVNGRVIEFLSKDRQEGLMGMAYTAAIKSEMLSFTDCLPFDLFTDITQLRRARNKWMHAMKEPTIEIASLSVQTALAMLNHVEGLRLTLTPWHDVLRRTGRPQTTS